MARAILMVMDSFGIGGAADAAAYGDEGSDTYGHIRASCARGEADRPGGRSGPLALPNLDRLGLPLAAGLDGSPGEGCGFFGSAGERSKGKDTPSGHWEIAGVPVPFDWGYFPRTVPTFPAALIDQIVDDSGIPGILGDRHASGTQIIAELGEDSIATGKPIFYTSADSVLQIAAHEEGFGLERLYALCAIARRHVDPLNIGRVIARPFVGTTAADFRRTANRRDYAVPPVEPTLLDRVQASGHRVVAIGKIGDIFAHQGIDEVRKGDGNMALFDAMLGALDDTGDGDLVFANFVDFDTLYGHRRDIAGYAAALEAFDRRLPELERRLRADDLAVITADHGCDPSWTGSDHTRERVPILGFGPQIRTRSIGRRDSFADIGETIAAHLGLAPGRHGRSFL
ncbi:phosphopentomutase [Mangrovibrevibacter kandeliae]|uniref:phosphopentomutase n=1 Tax=Mangrovibrevibacter kandeliae TaxID=2968473 RepID=UPI0021193747|nr:phosphopentomutase [Aurantimonas sp. CSK15Z-1]MCQ8783522.1 phosphopentomutase [Aurantimonas sp. CSK15Z-1]